jgi:hypothetical protein
MPAQVSEHVLRGEEISIVMRRGHTYIEDTSRTYKIGQAIAKLFSPTQATSCVGCPWGKGDDHCIKDFIWHYLEEAGAV